MKKTKNKGLRRTLGFIALALVVAILAVMPLMASSGAAEEEFPLSILSAQAEQRQIDLYLSGGGSLLQEEAQSVSVPTEVKLTEFLVKNGDAVSAGDPIARVDRVSVMAAIAQTHEAMAEVAAELESERTASTSQTIKAPGGLVKAVYAQSGDLVSDVMLEHGSLALVSLDSLMAVQLGVSTDLTPGDTLSVTVNGQSVTGTVKTNLEGLLTVTLPDDGYEVGTPATLATAGGETLGQGELYVHAPWNAVAYSGTVNYVSVREGQYLYTTAPVLSIKDMGYSAQYRALAQQHRRYEEQMMDLFIMYQDLTLKAPCDGVVSGIDENSAQLLKGSDGYGLTLLANAPNGDDETQYHNFVGQVLAIGTDGNVILRLNPQFIAVSDYTDLSGVPLDTAAMTIEIEAPLSAPVYRWIPESSEEETEGDGTTETTEPKPTGWVSSTYAPGDILLFSGQLSDSFSGIAWIIRVGSAALPEGWGQQDPTEPTDPTIPSDPTTPTIPSDPTTPTTPGDPTTPTIPGDDGSGDQRPSGGGFGSIGGFGGFGSIGGYSGYSGTEIPEEQTLYGTDTVEVALVTPQDTMTLDITVDEQDLRLVSMGQSVQITVDALIGRQFTGTVTSIGKTGENTGGSSKFTVTVTLDRGEDMLSGMNAAVTIPLRTESGVAIPVAALDCEGGLNLVYTALDPETGEPGSPVEVTTGASDGEYVLVTGLEAGTTVYYGYYEALDTGVPQMPQMPQQRP